LAEGQLSFTVQATDPAGNISEPVTVAWTVEAPPEVIPPQTTLTASPPASTSETSASFSFVSDQEGSTFECSLNGASFGPCGSPITYNDLGLGDHIFEVRAVNMGNVGSNPGKHTWTLVAPPDTTPPQISISGAGCQHAQHERDPDLRCG
jgi:hypothetical protein